MGAPIASIFGITIKVKGIFLIFLYRDDVMMDRCCIQKMTSRRFTKFTGEYDMAVYENTRRRLQDIFEVLKIDMNKFKSIWGLMLRI